MDWTNVTRATSKWCVIFFSFIIKKINLKSRTWKSNEYYLKINEDWENNSEVSRRDVSVMNTIIENRLFEDNTPTYQSDEDR